MRIDLKTRDNPNIDKYRREDLDTAYNFASELHKELGTFLKAVVLFGSTARHTETAVSDIDILIVIDDISIHMSKELISTYRIIVEKLIAKISIRLHVTTIRFTNFWDYIRNGDPIGINILRDGVALIDTGFFDPLQLLLKRGRIRPSHEAVWTYFVRAPNSLHNARWHILQSIIDLYWAVIDASHAALMKLGETPPTPSHVADMLDRSMVQKGLLEKKYINIMRNFYHLSKMINHRQISEVKGEEFDRYHKQASDFVERMRKFIDVR
ncbi:MAG: nucleotidyltransferase domain-containing protein [Nanoarchaeota archaeon]|nr:nucleotidyltransferase domain-containing protein [Nanoarchaeota archaeon]MBU1704831.1 nucleotidyltransferase domain-containing protein [Nanoarchaeota archaeon]